MAPGQAKLTFAVSKVFSACNEPWNYCMPSKMAADEKPKEQVPQAETAWKWNLKHKVSFLIWIVVKFRTKPGEWSSRCPKKKQDKKCDKTYDEQLFARFGRLVWKSWEAKRVQRLGWGSRMLMLRCFGEAKTGWPRLGLIWSRVPRWSLQTSIKYEELEEEFSSARCEVRNGPMLEHYSSYWKH